MPERSRVITVERALHHARSGDCRTIEEIRRALRREDCVAIDALLAGPALKEQLRALIIKRHEARNLIW